MEQEFKVYEKLSEADSQMKCPEVSMFCLLVLSSGLTSFDTWEWMSKMLPHLCPAAGTKECAVSSQL